MEQEQIKKLTAWIPLLIAAGYFAFLIATWYEFIQTRRATMESFDSAVEEWLRNKDKPVEDAAKHDESN